MGGVLLSPANREKAVVAAGVLLAAWVGWRVGAGALVLPVLVCGGVAYAVAVGLFRCRWEAPALALLVLGYLVGNRGFAQLAPPGLPLLPGEAGVLVVLAATLLRIPLERELPLRVTPMNVLLGLWMGTSALHLLFDLPASGFLAVRDFAMVYYALFFFAGQMLARDRSSVRLVEWALGIGLAVMGVGFLVSQQWPEVLAKVAVKGMPLFYYKGDLVGIFSAAGLLFYYGVSTRCRARWARWGLTGLMALSAGVMLVTLARAAMLGLAAGLLWLLVAGQGRVLGRLAAVGALGALALVTADVASQRTLTESRLYGALEHVVSLADLGGDFDYQNPDSTDTGANNRFRLVWWRTLIAHVAERAPLQGVGFGYDLANPFIEEYYPAGNEEFTARSPHNFLLSVFGRTGLLGLILWTGFLAAWMVVSWRQARRAREEPARFASEPVFNAMAWTLFTGACFQVVLEGPMGAVLFWLLLGLAQARPRQDDTLRDDGVKRDG